MISRELSDYISKARSQGKSDEEIRGNLLAAGWNVSDVDMALIGDLVVTASSRTELLPIGDLVQVVIDRLKERYKEVALIMALPALLTAIFSFGSNQYVLNLFPESSLDIESPAQIIEIIGGLANSGIFVVGAIVLILYMIVYVLSQAALIFVLAKNRHHSWKAAYSLALSKLPLYFVLGTVTFFATITGYLLFIIPGIYLSLLLSFAPVILLLEGKGVFYSIGKSRWYTSGVFVPIALRFLVYFACVMVISIPIGIVEAIPGIGPVFSILGQIVLQGFAVAFLVILYEDLVSLKTDTNQDFVFSSGFKVLTIVLATIGILLFAFLIAAFSFAFSNFSNQLIYDLKQGGSEYTTGYEDILERDLNPLDEDPVRPSLPPESVEDPALEI